MAQLWHLKDWFPDAANNNEASPRGAKEKMDRDQVNDTMREMMGAVNSDWIGHDDAGGAWRDPNQGASVSKGGTNQVVIAGIDVRDQFPLNRKARVQHVSGSDVYGFVSAVSFSTNTTVTLEDMDDGDTVASNANGIQFSSSFGSAADHQIGRNAYLNTLNFVVPATTTAAGIQAALTLAASENRVVLLEAVNYTIEDTITLVTDSVIWGSGLGATKLTLGNSESKPVFQLGSNATDVELQGFEIDGNSSNQAGLGQAIVFGEGNKRVRIANLFIHLCHTNGIEMGASVTTYHDIHIDRCIIIECGDNCISITDPSGTEATGIFLSNLVLEEPGDLTGSGVLSGSCITTAAGIHANNIEMTLNSGGSHTGAGFKALGDRCVLTNFNVESLSGNTAGAAIIASGDDNVFSGGQVDVNCLGFALSGDRNILSDIKFNKPLLGTMTGNDNLVNGCYNPYVAIGGNNNVFNGNHFEDTVLGGGAHLTCLAGSNNNNVIGNTFDNHSDGIQLDGTSDGNIISGNIFNDMTTGIQIDGTSDDNVITNNTFATMTTGVRADATANNNVISHNVFDDCTTGVVLASGAVECIAVDNIYTGTYTDGVVDAGTRSGTGPVHIELASTQTGIASTEVIITGMGDVSFALPGNGKRRFFVTLNAMSEPNSDVDVEVFISSGSTGDETDTTRFSKLFPSAANDHALVCGGIIIPAANDTFTCSVKFSGGTNHDLLTVTTALYDTEYRGAHSGTWTSCRYIDG